MNGQVVSACCLVGMAVLPDASAQGTEKIETVTVVGVAPMPLGGLPLELVPANVQIFSADALLRLQALDLAQHLNRAAAGVFINEAQNNPLQPDLQYRGFTASPLLGLPQGLAVYIDGVRANEPFGDTVNWALIPGPALARVTLTPGASPLFGGNALGGALALTTKTGASHPGADFEALYGSHGRRRVEGAFGSDPDGGWSYFAAGSWFDEAGWRDFSPSRVDQLFGNARFDGDGGFVSLSAMGAQTDLVGNGPVPVELLREDRSAIFTRPDRTRNDLLALQANGAIELSPSSSLGVVAHHRRSDARTLNGDDSPYEECDDEPTLFCEEGGELVRDASGAPIALTPSVSGGSVNRSTTLQRSEGVTAQFSGRGLLFGRVNYLTAGVSYERSRTDFSSSTELASLDHTRGALGAGIFDADSFVDLYATTSTRAFYLSNTVAIDSKLSLTLESRYERFSVTLRDRLGDALNGDHKYSLFNPAAGLTWRLNPAVQVYAKAGEASRVPSPAELTCADPEDPCRLPNAFLSDPPLDPVISRSFEAGLRGGRNGLRWSAGAFTTVNRDDILFISAGALTNEGYFDNVGRTRRQGVELQLSGSALADRLSWFVRYTHLQAEFGEDFTVAAPHNPQAQQGEIPVNPGDRIPGVPRHLLKAGVDAELGRLSLGADLSYASDQHLRGDEGNLLGGLGGYSVLNLRASFELAERVSIFASVENLFDREYATFGVLGEPDEVLGDDYEDPRFVSPGAPRSIWAGVRVSL